MANNPISQSNQVEFNDSVLTTKAWNSSRYDGKQLKATEMLQDMRKRVKQYKESGY